MLKRYLTSLGTAVSAASLQVSSAFAALPDPSDVTGLDQSSDISSVVLKVIGVILDVILIIAVLYVIIAGIRLIVSGGDEGQKDSAKKTIIYVIAGIIVILFARAIVVFINNAFAS